MKKLIALADLAQSVKNAVSRNKKCRLIKAEMTKLKRRISKTAKAITEEKSPVKTSDETPVNEPSSAKKRPVAAVSDVANSGNSSDGNSSSSEDKPLKPPVKPAQTKVTNMWICQFLSQETCVVLQLFSLARRRR